MFLNTFSFITKIQTKNIQASALMLFCLFINACSIIPKTPTPYGEVEGRETHPSELLQSDVNRIATIAIQEGLEDISQLQNILYDLNPKELAKTGLSKQEAKKQLWTQILNQEALPNSNNTRGMEAVKLALNASFTGDRVGLYSFGVADILLSGFGDRTDFYLINGLNPQRLFNSSKELEMAAQMLHEENLNFIALPDQNKDARIERAFGSAISITKILAISSTEKYRRIGINYAQSLIGGNLWQFLPVGIF